MTSELELKIVNQFPELCRNYQGDMKKTCFAFGFECGNGWFDLIWDTFSQIDKISKENNLGLYIEQVKSKFGGLRIYIDFDDKENSVEKQEALKRIYAIINKAEDKSFNISEKSGEPAVKHVIGGWHATLTDKEAEEFKKDRC